MLLANTLERVFVIEEGVNETELADPERSFTPKAVLNFYSGTYPILTTATVEGPEIKDDKMYYTSKYS